jgi:hypothetical protein
MNGKRQPRVYASVVCVTALSAVVCLATPVYSADGTPAKILGVSDLSGKSNPDIALNDSLVVKLDGTGPVDPTKYILFLDGQAIDGLTDTLYESAEHALIFHLRRNSTNAVAWGALLGSPTLHPKAVSVALGVTPVPPAKAEPTLTGPDGVQSQFQLVALPGPWLALAAVAVLVVTIFVWGSAKRSTVLKDNLLPQMPANQQPYSLARWQMAFWFTLIVAAFSFLFVLLWDYNTVTPQALMLMGISGATALAAVAVDATKDSPIGAANIVLRALGINTYEDVLRIREEIADRDRQLKATTLIADPATVLRLQTEIADRQRLLRTYADRIAPFASQGWFRDLTTDINGPALHRLQVFCWTWILGGVFLIGLYQTLSMPEFNSTPLPALVMSASSTRRSSNEWTRHPRVEASALRLKRAASVGFERPREWAP